MSLRREAEKTAVLQRAHDCYTRFGMTAQAARVAKELSEELRHCAIARVT